MDDLTTEPPGSAIQSLAADTYSPEMPREVFIEEYLARKRYISHVFAEEIKRYITKFKKRFVYIKLSRQTPD